MLPAWSAAVRARGVRRRSAERVLIVGSGAIARTIMRGESLRGRTAVPPSSVSSRMERTAARCPQAACAFPAAVCPRSSTNSGRTDHPVLRRVEDNLPVQELLEPWARGSSSRTVSRSASV
jgi:hypothetical protein